MFASQSSSVADRRDLRTWHEFSIAFDLSGRKQEEFLNGSELLIMKIPFKLWKELSFTIDRFSTN